MARERPAPRPLVIGLGTDERSDDGIGLDVVRALAREGRLAADLVLEAGDPSRILFAWEGRLSVLLVDAVRSGLPPGTVHRWDRDELGQVPSEPAVSSHSLSLAHVLTMARALDQLPPRLIVFGIEVAETGVGTERSEVVREAIPTVCRRIAEELEGGSPRGPAAAVRST